MQTLDEDRLQEIESDLRYPGPMHGKTWDHDVQWLITQVKQFAEVAKLTKIQGNCACDSLLDDDSYHCQTKKLLEE